LHIVTLDTIVPEVDSEGISFILPFTTVTWVESLRTFKDCQQVTNFTTEYLCRKLSYIWDKDVQCHIAQA